VTAPVRIDASAWGDLRFATLARLCGFADAEHALIKVAKIWSWQTEHYTDEAPTYEVDLDTIESALGEGSAINLIRARLAEEGPLGFRIKGSKGRIEWLWKSRNASRKGGEATKRKHADKEGPLGPPAARPEAMPQARPDTGPKTGPLSPDLAPDPSISNSHAPRAIVRSTRWELQKAWWTCMLEAHDRLRAKGIVKPNEDKLAANPHEAWLFACEKHLRTGGYDDDGVDAKMRHVVLVCEAEAETLGHSDFFKPAIIWDTERKDRFPRKVDTSIEQARAPRTAPTSRAGPRAAGSAIGAADPRKDHPVSEAPRSFKDLRTPT
jgi:hypothetical protein